MAIEFPFSFQDIDLMRIAVGFFITLIVFGILQGSKIIGKSKPLNFIVAVIMGFYVMFNNVISNFILDFSSNFAVLLLIAVVLVMMMSLSGSSSMVMVKVFLSVVLILPFLNIYPFNLLRDVFPENLFKILLIVAIVVIALLWILWRKK